MQVMKTRQGLGKSKLSFAVFSGGFLLQKQDFTI